MEGEGSWWSENGDVVIVTGSVGLLCAALFTVAMARLPFILFGNKIEDE